MEEITLETLCGEHLFSGIEMTVEKYYSVYQGEEVDCDVCLFTFDSITYKVVENPDDGYRSYCGYIEISDQKPKYQFPGIKVVCHMMEDTEGLGTEVLVVRDILNGKPILEVGTVYADEYYPYCHFHYMPENMSCNSERRNRND